MKILLRKYKSFLYNLSYKIFHAEINTDLIAIPYFLGIFDIDLISHEFYSYLSLLDEEKIDITQKFIVLNKSAFEKIPLNLNKYFTLVEELDANKLKKLLK